MDEPLDGAQLHQFFCALQWVKTCIPDFSRLVEPLHLFLEKLYTRSNTRKKRSPARVSLPSAGWGKTERETFKSYIDALPTRVTLANCDTAKRLCIYTGASDTFWSGIMTQVLHENTSPPHAYQRHEPLAFLSGRLNAQQARWSTLEKEAYAVLATLQCMHWLAATLDGFDLFTDHNNLIYLFDPLFILPDMSQTTLRKVLRWAVRLSAYNYTCIYSRGTDIVWADLLGRWTPLPAVRRLFRIPALPSASSDDSDWPSTDNIAAEQHAHSTTRPPNLVMTAGLWSAPSGSTLIRDDSSDLQLRLCVIAHTSAAGHRGVDTTERTLSQHYSWSTLSFDTSEFVKACVHCLSTTGGEEMLRPFGPSLYGTCRNDLLQFDYIDLGISSHGARYVLIMRNDYSNYKLFPPFVDTSASNAAIAIIDWCAAFGVPESLMSDVPRTSRTRRFDLLQRVLKSHTTSRCHTVLGLVVQSKDWAKN